MSVSQQNFHYYVAVSRVAVHFKSRPKARPTCLSGNPRLEAVSLNFVFSTHKADGAHKNTLKNTFGVNQGDLNLW